MLTIQIDHLQYLKDPQEGMKISRMQPFLAQIEVQEFLVEEQQKIQVTLQIKDHLPKVLILLLPESQDQGITVQDLMINQVILNY